MAHVLFGYAQCNSSTRFHSGFPIFNYEGESKWPYGALDKTEKDYSIPNKTRNILFDNGQSRPYSKEGDEYLQFFSATTKKEGSPYVQRTLSIARTEDLDGPWTLDPQPMVPIEEQIENSSLYFEESSTTWFLFTNHIGIDEGTEFTDAIWVYFNQWNPNDKAIVLDGENCSWSNRCIGLPSVVKVDDRLALFYDAPEDNGISHMKRNIGLAWIDLPLSTPEETRE